MSRSKKSRKPGVGSSGAVKENRENAKTPAIVREKRAKKLNGKPSGNRRTEAKPKEVAQNSQSNKDPRIGNKTPIALGNPSTKKPVAAKASNKVKPTTPFVAPIRTIEPEHVVDTDALMQQLETIEQDQGLLAILSKQDDEIELTESEVDFFNEQMEKHQNIREALGLDDEDTEDEDSDENEPSKNANTEDDLWDKFDNSDLSKFE